jgi:CubicO group peptidase (beta-lactamase class C family)
MTWTTQETSLASLAAQGQFSGVALVRREDETLLEGAYGDADRASGRPNTPETTFQIASISKQFTAAAILLLRERGMLYVHDSIRVWMQECPTDWERITLHHLLTHTSGIGHWRDFPALNLKAPITREALLRTFYQGPLLFAPGEGWAYSSPGYALLAHVVERATGEPYAAFLRRVILDPLQMSSTGAGNQAPQPERQASGYAGAELEPSFDLATVGMGAGDAWSTTRDLAPWNATLAMPGALLSEATLRMMFTPYATMPDDWAPLPDVHYGYGWIIGAMQGRPIRFHPGDNAGFNALNVYAPDCNASVILLSNDEGGANDSRDLGEIGLRLVTELLESVPDSDTS